VRDIEKEIIEGVDFMVNPRFQGRPTGQPSSIIAFGEDNEFKIIRE
jgi:L-threonylcarbamoyladenylate synthase